MLLRFLFLLGVACAYAPARADDVGVIAGHTWTRNEVIGETIARPPESIVGTGRCFTISLPYSHPLRGAWSWTVQPTSYHLEYKGPAISSAEVPFTLRWSARGARWSPFLEAGPGLHYGAGLSPGDERRAHLTPCLDAGFGVVGTIGVRRVVVSLRTVSAPQHGEWARRVALLAGMMQSIAPRDRGAPMPPSPGGPPRDGSLLGSAHIAGLRIGVLGGYHHRASEGDVRGDVLYAGDDSVAAGEVVESVTPQDGPIVSLALDLLTTSRVSLSLQPSIATVHETHAYSVNGVPFAREEGRAVVVRIPVQMRIGILTGAVRPYVSLGPTIHADDIQRTENAYFVSSRTPPSPRSDSRIASVLAAGALDPTFGVTADLAGHSVYAEVRSLASYAASRWRNEYSIVAGIDLTPAPHTARQEDAR